MVVSPELPPVPAPLKNIQQYLKVATTHDQRDCVVSYWCRLYALQTGLKLSTKTSEETSFLLKLMNWLETTKKELHDNEAITNDVCAQAHLENWALKLFLYADQNDRASNFGKNIIQSFYTAGLLYDVLTVFGELTDEAAQNRKYAKWKATYLHNCIKNGETPVPGPLKDEDGEDNLNEFSNKDNSNSGNNLADNEDNTSNLDASSPTNVNIFNPTPAIPENDGSGKSTSNIPDFKPSIKVDGGIDLSTEQITKAQKYIKWAGSALNYDDVPTSVLNLQKAVHLLTTGQDPA
ncbi:PREDICTED: vacuolar protein sorting-associated protein VTA1 homolog isoform X1 [Polistes dominula]|uniref:Vacuolar protein sorting-associated protein VTA1 homolog isoform X1 n=1 Tax=Polistes dominula TaxID=743375 RepID=A0ABM1JGE0_POLDO|nr:PREDICTED: vacuolar protein sorting-associated protein VTA1 homolog isoform X1 [Polistes dominula]XP_015191529.1 PREDICTED: vacuolar protein sorting-associated protein VTA1 homolog isoform X1 [Polistes dominula]